MTDTATTKRHAKLTELLRLSRFENWPHDRLIGELDKLYGKTRAAKQASKTPAKK